MQLPLDNNDPGFFAEADENQYFDRKSARLNPKETARHICAFANASGGKLVIGIEDDGTVTGFKRGGARSIEEFERAALAGCEPVPEVHPARIPVTNSRGEDDRILVLEISPSSGHVISRRSDKAVFLR
nr:ATP-binding protein [uncultured Olsenella sp.]